MAKRNRYLLTSLLAAVMAGMPATPRTQWRCVGHVVPQHCSRRLQHLPDFKGIETLAFNWSISPLTCSTSLTSKGLRQKSNF